MTLENPPIWVDVFPIEHGDFPASHVIFQGYNPSYPWIFSAIFGASFNSPKHRCVNVHEAAKLKEELQEAAVKAILWGRRADGGSTHKNQPLPHDKIGAPKDCQVAWKTLGDLGFTT